MGIIDEVISAWPAVTDRSLAIVLGVSGGADSVALLQALCEIRGAKRIIAGHFNHQARFPESDDEEAFVRQWAQHLKVECKVGRLNDSYTGKSHDVQPIDEKPNADTQIHLQEELGRKHRHEFLLRTARQYGARYVALAHTRDDQVETILHRILRGTGVTGLAGIRPHRLLDPAITLVHPLLGVSRCSIEEYLRSINQPYCIDESNFEMTYTRNRIRHDLLPSLRDNFNPRVDDAILRLGDQAAAIDHFIRQAAEQLLERHVSSAGDVVHVRGTNDLQREDAVLVRRMFALIWRQAGWPEQGMTSEHWSNLVELACKAEQRPQVTGLANRTPVTGARRLTMPGAIEVQKKGDAIELRRL